MHLSNLKQAKSPILSYDTAALSANKIILLAALIMVASMFSVLVSLTQYAEASNTTEADTTGIQPSITRLASDDAAGTSIDIVKQAYSGDKKQAIG